MVVNALPPAGQGSGEPARNGPLHPASAPCAAVLWHDLECGSYRADLWLWQELARACPDGTILDIGAGTGRVALELARTGRRLIALDRDPELLAALRERAAELDLETVCADARSFELPRREQVALCLAPMQTVQLLGGPEGRLAFLRRARAHLRPGGLLACALVTDLDPFDCTDGGPQPAPETMWVGATLYTTQPTCLAIGRRTIAIERDRRVIEWGDGGATRGRSKPGRSPLTTVERNLIELDRLSVVKLKREGAAIGLRPEPARHIAATGDHAGSAVVILRA